MTTATDHTTAWDDDGAGAAETTSAPPVLAVAAAEVLAWSADDGGDGPVHQSWQRTLSHAAALLCAGVVLAAAIWVGQGWVTQSQSGPAVVTAPQPTPPSTLATNVTPAAPPPTSAQPPPAVAAPAPTTTTTVTVTAQAPAPDARVPNGTPEVEPTTTQSGDDEQFVAVSLSPRTQLGAYGRAGTQARADQIALNECTAHTGDDLCLVAARMHHGCVSVVFDDLGGWAGASGADQAAAEAHALALLPSATHSGGKCST